MAKSAWSQVVASTPYDVAGFLLSVNAQGNGGNSALVDIGIGASGQEKILVENVLVGQLDDNGVTMHQTFPMRIPAGTRVTMRGQSNAASKNMYPQMTFFTSSFMFEEPFQRATTYGADTTNSKGTQVDPGGSANTKGAWSVIDTSTTNPMKALILFLSNDQNTTTTLARQHFDIAVGSAGNEKIIVPDVQISVANEHTVSPSIGPLPCDIPAGSRLSVRSQCNITTTPAREWDCVIVGLD